jgi:hypothetical protein
MSHATSGFGSPVIETGVVYDVNVVLYSISVASQSSSRRWDNIPLMAPYVHYAEGEGVFVMPEPGATCWVCQSSEIGDRAFVLGFGVTWNEEGSYGSTRRPMNPGDIYLGTRDGNSVFVRRGGVVQIQATPLAQRMYIPINNIIRDLCESYHLRAFGGDFLWEVDRDETTTTGDRPTRCKIFAKEQADDPHPLAELILGQHENDSALSLKVYDKGEDGRTVQVELDVAKDGSVSWVLKGAWSLKSEKTILLQAKQAVNVKSTDAEINLTAKTDVKSDSANFKVLASSIQLGAAGAALDALLEKSSGTLTSLKLAGGGSPVVKGTELNAALQPLLTALQALTPTAPSCAAVVLAATASSKAMASAMSSKVQVG